MKFSAIKVAMIGAFGLFTNNVFSLGFVNIPTTGFATSAYTLCNTTGNFGSGSESLGSGLALRHFWF